VTIVEVLMVAVAVVIVVVVVVVGDVIAAHIMTQVTRTPAILSVTRTPAILSVTRTPAPSSVTRTPATTPTHRMMLDAMVMLPKVMTQKGRTKRMKGKKMGCVAKVRSEKCSTENRTAAFSYEVCIVCHPVTFVTIYIYIYIYI
jgi:hypothetical protein